MRLGLTLPQGRSLPPLPRRSGRAGGRRGKAGRIRPAGCNRCSGAGAEPTWRRGDPAKPEAWPAAGRAGAPGLRLATGQVRAARGKKQATPRFSDLGEDWLLPLGRVEVTAT